MQDTYEKCPICGKTFKIAPYPSSANTLLYYCNNERDITFAKAGDEPLPEYHNFSYFRDLTGSPTVPCRTLRWILVFNLTRRKIIRVIRYLKTEDTSIQDFYGRTILTIEQPLEPDFPSLEKLRNKIKTCLNFS